VYLVSHPTITQGPGIKEHEMTERGKRLYAIADQQITELTDLIQTLDEPALHLPCAGREKLGDGTIAACAQHTAHNYQRIGTFVATTDRMTARHATGQRGGHQAPRFLRALGHQPGEQSRHGADGHGHNEPYTAQNTSPADLIEQLSAARENLSGIAELTDQQLDTTPPKDSFRFCDGQRTLEQVLTGLLKHQDHQIRALRSALSGTQ
jgi:hypothetical protein